MISGEDKILFKRGVLGLSFDSYYSYEKYLKYLQNETNIMWASGMSPLSGLYYYKECDNICLIYSTIFNGIKWKEEQQARECNLRILKIKVFEQKELNVMMHLNLIFDESL